MSDRNRLTDGLHLNRKRVVIRELAFTPFAAGEGAEPQPSDLQVTHEPDEIVYDLAPDLTPAEYFAMGVQAAARELDRGWQGVPMMEITRE